MLIYYKVDRTADKEKYIISLYYRGLFGQFKEMHRSVHGEVKDLNEVVAYYKSNGYHIQSIATA